MFRQKGPWVPKYYIIKPLPSILRKFNILKHADAFKNYPVIIWQDLFAKIFKDKIAYISFTGGEPLFHNKKIIKLMETVADVSDDFIIRFDTNGSVIPRFPEEFKEKITYVVSYHGSQVKLDKFLQNLEQIGKQGTIHMVNRVVFSETELSDAIEEMKLFAMKGYFMNISPAYFDVSGWRKENIELLKSVTHPLDYELRVERKTKGKKCRWPTIGFRLLPTGYADVFPCHNKTINLLKTKNLNEFLSKKEIVCPSVDCTCLHAYSFQDCTERNAYSYDILDNFVTENIDYRIKNNSQILF